MSCGTYKTTEKGELIGKVSHYFDRVGVAIVELTGAINVGDTIRITGGEVDFNQEVDSMEVDHQKIKSAKKGDSIGIKVAEKAKEGYLVYNIK